MRDLALKVIGEGLRCASREETSDLSIDVVLARIHEAVEDAP
jgi:hypothetical protein